MRKACPQEKPNVFFHLVAAFRFKELMVPNSFNQNSAVCQGLVSFAVMLHLVRKPMTESVQLDAQLGFQAVEVEVAGRFHVLAAELVSGQPA